MSKAKHAASIGAGLAGIVGEMAGIAVPGASIAGNTIQAIHQSCEQVGIHREKCATLSTKCGNIKELIDEHVNTIAIDEFRVALDELAPTLQRVNQHVSKWKHYPGWKLWLQSSKIEAKLVAFISDVDNALERFNKHHQIILIKEHQKHEEALRQQNYKIDDILILLREGKQTDLVEAARNHPEVVRRAVGDVQAQFLELEHVERGGRSRSNDSSNIQRAPLVPRTASPERSSTLRDEPTNSKHERSTSEVQHSEKYHQLKENLRELIALGLPTEVAVLDGQVARNTDDPPLATSARADVWTGVYLGRKVALKGYRNIKKSDRVRERFVEELKMWNDLHDDHIVQFYGVTYDIGNTAIIVSALQPNRDIAYHLDNFKYGIKETGVQPEDFARAKLMRGAAQGLAYLHSKNIVHGNIKCSKIYVSESWDAKIGDFGMSKLLEDVQDAGTITEVSSSRFSVPELFERNRAPDFQTDIWQFASSVLNCFSNEVPYHDIKRNGHVVKELIDGRHPNRPTDELSRKWITDEVWALLIQCWAKNPEQRPTMNQVRERMFKIEHLLRVRHYSTSS